jgi:crossover junction endodeoxyribonuclease RuvC
MQYIGIDPGISGGVAVIEDGKPVRFFDTPSFIVKKGKRNASVYDIPGMVRIFHEIVTDEEQAFVTMEKVGAMPDQGVVSVFNFGMGFGIWQGILVALQLRYELVHPVRWKKLLMQDMEKEKDASRIRAMQLFPQAAGMLNLKKHHNRADALLLAHYGQRTYTPAKPLEQPHDLFGVANV